MVKVKFCGNCNPDVNPKKVKKALEALFADIPREDMSIMVNGCSRACLTKRNPPLKNKNSRIFVNSKDVIDKAVEDER